MTRLFIFLMILLGLAVWLVPYSNGFLFRTQFENYILQLQAIAAKNSQIKITLNDYHVGWLQSTGHVEITLPNNGQTLDIAFIIHHGPIIQINHKFLTSLAYIEGTLLTPHYLERMIKNPDQGLMKMTTLVDFNQTIWITNYNIPAQEFIPGMKWDGLTGEMSTTFTGAAISAINNKVTLNEFNLNNPIMKLKIHADPIVDEMATTYSSKNAMTMNHNIKVGVIAVLANDYPVIQIKSLSLGNQATIDDTLMTLNSDLTVNNANSIYIKDISPITELKYHLNVSGINKFGIKTINKESKADTLLATLTASSKLNLDFSMATSNGNTSATVDAFISKKFQTIQELLDGLNINAKIRMNQKLLLQLMTLQDPNQSAQLLLDNWIKQGMAAVDGDDIVANITKTDTTTDTNGSYLFTVIQALLIPTQQAVNNNTP